MTEQECGTGRKALERFPDLSFRLQAVAELVTGGYRMADIGTDHAYVPICLVKAGRIPGAIAADVNKGPLLRAAEHIKANRLENQIETRLSDGFSALKPGEVQSAVLAGMGGGLMIRILKEGAGVTEYLEECILQPQSEVEKVRAFLLEEGFLFLEENMVLDDGKYYPMMKVKPPCRRKGEGKSKENPLERAQKQTWTEVELRYGKILLERQNPVLHEFLEREHCIKQQILSQLEKKDSGRIRERRKEVEMELECTEKGLSYYAVQRDYTGN